MTSLKPGVQHSMKLINATQCNSAHGESCVDHGPGHAMRTLHERVSAATPSKWRDGIVSTVSADGWIALEMLETDERVWVWNHVDRTASVTVGQPVALHAIYHALAFGRERINVLVAERAETATLT